MSRRAFSPARQRGAGPLVVPTRLPGLLAALHRLLDRVWLGWSMLEGAARRPGC
jgi:hypothetical protein